VSVFDIFKKTKKPRENPPKPESSVQLHQPPVPATTSNSTNALVLHNNFTIHRDIEGLDRRIHSG
jgi:hypothetical protein